MSAEIQYNPSRAEIKDVEFGDVAETIVPTESEYDRDKHNKEVQRKRYEQDTQERKLLSHWVMVVVTAWLGIVIVALIINGIGIIKISDTVACVLLGTTTLNILGLAYIVLKGLFPESK